MNDCSISSVQHIVIWIGEASFTKWLVPLMDSIFIQYNAKMILACSTANIIHNQIIWMTELLVMNDSIVSGQVE